MLREYDARAGQFRGSGGQRPVDPAKFARATDGSQPAPAPPFYWAAFQLSGDWR
jgi:hypothetical protein